ncbi:DinB family protein [Chloroflexota bacterium]
MEWKDLLIDGYGRIPEFLEKVLKGLIQGDLDWQPRHDCNSISWLIWHLTRQQDAQTASLMGEEQLWSRDKWYAKFNQQPEPDDIGFGHSPEQVSAFRSPSAKILLDYNRAVVERSKQYISNLSETDLGRELDEPWFQPLPTVGVRLVSILGDSTLHAGQAAYVRGLRQGKGWQKY